MKILFVLENHYPNIGGVETLFKNLTEALVQQEIEVTVITNQYDRSLKRKENINGVDIIRLPFINRYLFTFLAFIPLISYARKYDLIHTTSYNAGVPAYIAGLLTRTKTIITFHEVWDKLWFRLPYSNKISLTLFYLFEKFLLCLPFAHYIAVSESTKTSLIDAGIKENKITRIYNGIDYSQFLNTQSIDKKPKPYTFIYFGRLGISKGINLLLTAVDKLSHSNSQFSVNLVIPKTPKAFYKTIIKEIDELDIKDHIKIYSHLPYTELQQLIRSSDAAIIPSYSEGFCFSAVEAMALDIPIIHSGQGALSEVVSGPQLRMEKMNAESLKLCMEKAITGNWDIRPKKEFPLSDSVEAYLDFYKNIKS